MWRVWGITNLYAALMLLLNHLWGTNYGYLAHKPSQASLLDYCGPWPWYLLSMEVVALGFFFICYTLCIIMAGTQHKEGAWQRKSVVRS